MNDAFADATVLAEEVDSRPGHTFDATKEAGEPDHAGDPGGASAWYEWTAPRSHKVFLQLCTEGWDALVGVYRGDSLTALRPVASSGFTPSSSCWELRFRATAGVSYLIAVDGDSAGGTAEADRGSFELTLRSIAAEIPLNDDFAQAAALEQTTYKPIFGTTEGATREPGEPAHGSLPGSASVWYRWTAPQAGAMRIVPCRASFDPVVGVYRGSALIGLESVAVSATTAGDCQLGGLGGVEFAAAAGETYAIAVDGRDGGWGRFELSLQLVVPPSVDDFPPGTHIRKLLRGRNGRIRFQVTSGEGGTTLLCKLDKRRFAPCTSPVIYSRLRPGRHRFAVKAVDAAGNVDPTPAVRRFRVRGRPRR